MKLLASVTVLMASLLSHSAHADSTHWRDASGQFRLIMLDPATTAYPVLLYGSNQRSGPGCAQPGVCSFVLRGQASAEHTLEFDALTLNARRDKVTGLEGHQSELPGQRQGNEKMVWSIYNMSPKQTRLTCISPKTSCDYFQSDITLEQDPEHVRP